MIMRYAHVYGSKNSADSIFKINKKKKNALREIDRGSIRERKPLKCQPTGAAVVEG